MRILSRLLHPKPRPQKTMSEQSKTPLPEEVTLSLDTDVESAPSTHPLNSKHEPREALTYDLPQNLTEDPKTPSIAHKKEDTASEIAKMLVRTFGVSLGVAFAVVGLLIGLAFVLKAEDMDKIV